jgi:hypothetical protein
MSIKCGPARRGRTNNAITTRDATVVVQSESMPEDPLTAEMAASLKRLRKVSDDRQADQQTGAGTPEDSHHRTEEATDRRSDALDRRAEAADRRDESQTRREARLDDRQADLDRRARRLGRDESGN